MAGSRGAKWTNWRAIIRDLGIALAVMFTMAVIGNLSNALRGPLQRGSAAFHWMVAQSLPWIHSTTMPGALRKHDLRLRSAGSDLYSGTLLTGMDPIGAGSAHRGFANLRGALAK
jgi:hypothetical protein